MESIKKYLPMIIIFMVVYFMMSKPKETDKKIEYKEGVFYERVGESEKKGFLSSILGKGKENQVKEISDVISVNFSKEKIESIKIEKNDNILKDKEKAEFFLEQIKNKKEVETKENKLNNEDKNIYNLLLNAVKKAETFSSKLLRDKVDKLPIGTFLSVAKISDDFMEVEVTTSNEKIEKIKVLKSNLNDKDSEKISSLIKKILDEKTIDIKINENSSDAEKEFIENMKNIVSETGIREEKYGVIKKGNIVWQTIKDVIARLILGVYNMTKNYGMAIILSTIIIKIILLPLTIKQDKSMKIMKKLQPEIEKAKEKHKGNPQMEQQATLEVYKKHGLSPMAQMAGCLPLLLQMPILFALFGVLRSGLIPEFSRVFSEAITLESGTTMKYLYSYMIGPVFIWLDLVNPDPYYILPVLTGVVTYLQQKMMSTGSGDNPMMKNMGVIMPLMMVFISLKMPSGLQLYWLISTVLSVVQQYWIMKRGE
jgi:YidC/Oxa1 family membrane protein insertase